MTRGLWLVLAASTLSLGLFPATSQAAETICCVCAPSNALAQKTCITGTGATCAEMVAASKNASLKGVSCDTTILKPGECKPKSETTGLCPGGPISEAAYSAGGDSSSETGRADTLVPLKLGVPIPGIEFANTVDVKNGKISVPFLAQYISGAYRYLTGISAIAAAIMIVYGGFLYIFAAGGGSVKKGRTIITDAVIGLILILGAYTILATVNPETLSLKALDIQMIRPEHAHVTTIPISTYTSILSDEPPQPGGGTITDGSCSFKTNQVGLPTVLSIYSCGIDVIAKEVGIDPCYIVAGVNKEAYLALPNSIGHDENALGKPVGNQGDLFPERIRFLAGGTTFKGVPITDPQHQLNDDKMDLSKPNLGLDTRYSHGGGLMQFTVKSACGKAFSKSDVIKPYSGMRAGAELIKCFLTTKNALETQTVPGTIAMVWTLWGGCYADGIPGKCPPFSPKSDAKYFLTAGGATEDTYACMQSGKPLAHIRKSNFTICRGDLPLDREACRVYVDTTLKEFNLDPKAVCDVGCFDSRMPIACGKNDKVCRPRH